MKKQDMISALVESPDELRVGPIHLVITGSFPDYPHPRVHAEFQMLSGTLQTSDEYLLISETVGDLWHVEYKVVFWHPSPEFMQAAKNGTLTTSPIFLILRPLGDPRIIQNDETFRGSSIDYTE